MFISLKLDKDHFYQTIKLYICNLGTLLNKYSRVYTIGYQSSLHIRMWKMLVPIPS